MATTGQRTDYSESGAPYPSAARAGFLLALLVLAAVIAYVDQQVFAFLVTPVKTALGLSDTDVGTLQGVALNLCMGLVALPMGMVIDRTNRVRYFALVTTLWSVFTILCGLCTNFSALFLCRVGVGAAEAGLYAGAYSLIADLYPLQRRSTAIFVFYGGVLLSASVATALSGMFLGFIETRAHALPWTVSPWRLGFVIIASPGLLLALLFAAVREPDRQVSTRESFEQGGMRFLHYLRQNKVTVVRIIGGSVASFAGYSALMFWMPTILTRRFGYSTASSSEIFSLTFGVGTIAGVLISAALVRLLRPRLGTLASLRVLQIGAFGTALAPPFLLFAHNATSLLAVYVILSTMTYVASPLSPTLLTAIAPNHLRARLFSINQIIGLAIGAAAPPLVGLFSDRVFGGPDGLLHACCAVIIPVALLGPVLLGRLDEPFLRTMNAVIPEVTSKLERRNTVRATART